MTATIGEESRAAVVTNHNVIATVTRDQRKRQAVDINGIGSRTTNDKIVTVTNSNIVVTTDREIGRRNHFNTTIIGEVCESIVAQHNVT